jgi:3-dehydroquinate dehydratase
MVCEPGIQWDNLIFASKSASGSGSGSRDHCALLMDEMIITSGIVYSVSQQEVYDLSELTGHNIKTVIYHDFHKMDSQDETNEDLSKMSYFNHTAEKLEGHKATGLTQVESI